MAFDAAEHLIQTVMHCCVCAVESCSCWTAKQAVEGVISKVPPRLATLLASLGIDASLWHDLVWNFKKYFGRGTCMGSPAAMAEDAERSGKRWHRGQKIARGFFAVAQS